MIDGAGTHNYTYDTLDRLTAATHPNQPNESYTYDDVGNRTASHQGSGYTYQAFNRLVAANGTSFGYDTNGNQTSKSDTNGSWTYSWDYENRLKQASLAGGVTVTYSYDALGRRVQRTSSASGTTRFVYDGADVVRDLDGTNAIVADYLNGPGIDNKLRQSSGATASYFILDHLGTTRALADTSGNLISSLSYDSFGKVISGSASTRYTYTGREIDSDMDLMYYRARWYERTQGRFASEDPIRLRGGLNLYRYVGQNPTNRTDPTGLYEKDVHYYLTYYLVMKMGCFTVAEARQIANGDQGVDENPATQPGLGRRSINSFYHALHPGSHQPYLDAHRSIATMARNGDLSALGVYLHYLQDTYSHAGYTGDDCGHGCFDWHYPDKTDSNVQKTVEMAQRTWAELNRFAREKNRCGCKEWTDASWRDVYRFAKAPGGPDFREINDEELATKIKVLGVPWR